ncbi:MAG: DUF6766 family protein [Bauldia sp.]
MARKPKPPSLREASIWRRYGYAWITAIFFVVTIVGHWIFGWYAYVNDETEHGQPPEVSQYVIEMGRDTLENWQSEFLQLLWQVGGLAVLLYVGSPQSSDGDERQEAKIDALLKLVDAKQAERIIADLDARYDRKG